jgi:bifunctional N-acetylglucosamine-1-phosphate-uridyltransferase/glucosamine-1-phosphate-acetyltransferase GlmU-like protein
MGRRTLVAVARPDGRYDCRIAHWGVDADPVAQSHPLGTGWTASAVLDALDATHEQVVVLDGSVRTYAVCWLDPTLSDIDDIALARIDDPESFRRWWVDRKDAACRILDSENRDSASVRRDLLAALRDRAAAVHCPDDASFLRGDR